MKKLLIALLLPFALAACVSTPKPLTANDVATVAVEVTLDQKVAAVSQKLAQHCAMVQIALAVGQGYAKDANVKLAVREGRIAVDKACVNPPQDVASAILLLANVAIQINDAVQASKVQL